MSFLQIAALGIALFTVYLLFREPLWLAWYYLESRRRKCRVPLHLEISFPLGISRVVQMLKLAKSYKLLEVQKRDLLSKIGVRTTLRQVPLQWQLFTIEPENIKSVLATNFSDYSLGIRHAQLAPVFGNGIFTLSGAGWKHSRAMLRPQFARDQISRVDQISDHAKTLIEAIQIEQNHRQWINIQEYFHLLTMDTATEFLFGESIESLDPKKKSSIVTRNGEVITSEDFVESYTFLNNYAFKRVIFSKMFWMLNSKEYREHRRRAQAFIDYYVDRALYATSFPEKNDTGDFDSDEEETESKDQKQVYIFALELAKVTRDPVVIRDQIFNILIAGRDTTAATLSFALYYLARDPALFEKLRDEVLEFFGTREEQRPITFESLKQASYLKFFINEVLRLAPVVPLNFRQAIRDTKLPVGGGKDGLEPVFVPKGTAVHYSVFIMHRDPKLWGPDADEFKPERWENLKLDHLWSYLPFNGGPRICLGQQFALTEIALTLTRLLQQFTTLTKGPQFPDEPKFLNSLTLMNAPPGVLVRFD